MLNSGRSLGVGENLVCVRAGDLLGRRIDGPVVLESTGEENHFWSSLWFARDGVGRQGVNAIVRIQVRFKAVAMFDGAMNLVRFS